MRLEIKIDIDPPSDHYYKIIEMDFDDTVRAANYLLGFLSKFVDDQHKHEKILTIKKLDDEPKEFDYLTNKGPVISG